MSTLKCNKLSGKMNSAIELLGDTWTLAIIGSLAQGEQRFCELQRSLDGVNPVTLTQRLKKLEIERVISRKEETVDKISVVYGLTQKGKAIVPVIEQLGEYANKFL